MRRRSGNISPTSKNRGSTIGRAKSMIRSGIRKVQYSGGIRAVQFSYARAIRRSVPFFEKVLPDCGRKLRGWGWVWQPTYSHRWLNEFYANKVDPYQFDGSLYEKGKYDHTLRLLDGQKFGRALEIGAAEGVFTRLLAPICNSLTTVEVAESAVARARDRLVDCSNVTVVQAALPNQIPDGQFDLILASDVLYYFPKDVLIELLALFEKRLNPAGTLLALHYLSNFGQAMLGRDVHDLMKGLTKLEVIHDETVEGVGPRRPFAGYAVTIFRKPDTAAHA